MVYRMRSHRIYVNFTYLRNQLFAVIQSEPNAISGYTLYVFIGKEQIPFCEVALRLKVY